MKRSFPIFLFSIFISFVSMAQQDTAAFRRDLQSLVLDAQSDFIQNQGKLEYEDTVKHKQYYTPKISLGGNDFFIQQQHDDAGAYKAFICSYNLTETTGLANAIVYLPVILDELNKMNSSGKYRGRDYKDESGTDVTELTDTDGNYILELASNAQTIILRLFAKSWGKR